MKIKKIKLWSNKSWYFEQVKENFVRAIIKELYNNKIHDCDYYTLQERMTFLKDIMEVGQEEKVELWTLFDCAYSMFEKNYGPFFKIYGDCKGIVWLIVSNEPLENDSDIYITKNELEALKGK